MPKYISKRKEKVLKKKQHTEATQRLRTLKDLLDCGAITEEEFAEKKKKYIDLL